MCVFLNLKISTTGRIRAQAVLHLLKFPSAKYLAISNCVSVQIWRRRKARDLKGVSGHIQAPSNHVGLLSVKD